MKAFSTLLAVLPVASAFVVQAPSPSGCGALCAEATWSRRSFMSTAFVATAASFAATSPAFAEESVDDLSMPTEEEQKARAVSFPFLLCGGLCFSTYEMDVLPLSRLFQGTL